MTSYDDVPHSGADIPVVPDEIEPLSEVDEQPAPEGSSVEPDAPPGPDESTVFGTDEALDSSTDEALDSSTDEPVAEPAASAEPSPAAPAAVHPWLARQLEDRPDEPASAPVDVHDEPTVTPTRSEVRRQQREAAKPAKREKEGSFLKELPFLVLIALGLALLIKAFFVQAFYIPSGSMEKTLHGCPGCSGDRVLVNKLVYDFRDPHRGEIIVFKGPSTWAPETTVKEPSNPILKFFRDLASAFGVAQPGEEDFIKRVIGVPGDTVQCCDSGGRVTVNGVPLKETYLYQDDHRPFGPVTVPKGRLWVMGDHRQDSADSRAHTGDTDHGTIPIKNVIGRAFVVVWPPSHWKTLGVPSTFNQHLNAVAPLAAGAVGTVPFAVVRRRRRSRR